MILSGFFAGLPDAVRGVDFRWMRWHSFQLSDAPVWYSQRARIEGALCGACDLGLPEFGCSCPPSEPLPIRVS